MSYSQQTWTNGSSGTPLSAERLAHIEQGIGNAADAADAATTAANAATTAAAAAVPTSRTVNGHPLSSNVSLTKSDVGLSSVDNTSDLGKPISTATQTALNAKQATLPVGTDGQVLTVVAGAWAAADPTGGGGGGAVTSVAGKTGDVLLTKSDVGLNNVNNTSDAAKPVSTATQTALDAKAPLASPTFTGTVGGITKAMVGLGSVDNTADTAKPVSTAQQAALDLKANTADVLADVNGTGLVDYTQLPAGDTLSQTFTSANYTTLPRITDRTDLFVDWRGDATTDSTMIPTNSLSGDAIFYNNGA